MKKSSAFLFALCLVCTPLVQAELSGDVSLVGDSGAHAKKEKQNGSQTKEITVTGIGATLESAEKQALASAIRQAVGAYMDSKTIIENEEIIQDRILSVSNAFVDKYELVGQPKKSPDGLIEITVVARVKTNQIVQALKENNLISSEVAGQNLWAEASTKVMNAQDAVAMLQAKIPEMIKSCVTITPLTKDGRPLVVKNSAGKEVPSTAPAILDEDASSGQATLTWYVEMGVDKKYYRETLFPLVKQCLDAISGVPAESITSKLRAPEKGARIFNDYRADNPPLPINQIESGIVWPGTWRSLYTWDVGFYVLKSTSKSFDSAEAFIYPKYRNKLVVRSQKVSHVGQTLADLGVKVLSADGEVICSEKIAAWQPFSTSGEDLVMVGPYANPSGLNDGTIKLQIPIIQKISVKIPIDMIKEVKTVQFALEPLNFRLDIRKRNE